MRFYGAFTGIAGVFGGLRRGVSAASPVSVQERRKAFNDTVCFYLMVRFSMVREPLCMVSLPLSTV
jgi:hypothetical protein